MLENARMTAVIPVRDLARARVFWEKMIGLSPHLEREGDSAVMYLHNNTALLVYQTEAEPGEATKAVIVVDDVAAEMADLKEHGVVFEDFDFPGLKTVDGIAEMPFGRTAWFKDPEGNYIGLSQVARS